MRTTPAGSRRSGHRGLIRGIAIPAAGLAALMLVAACGSSGSSGSGGSASKANKQPITLLFGTSGPAETAADKAAAAAFTKQSGIKVNVQTSANLTQQLAQDFAGGTPPNLFYLDPTSMQEYAKQGVLDAYGSSMPNVNDFYPSLKSAFTYKGTLECVPKDSSTLSLYINNADWKAAGLTSYPTNWTQLAADAKKLTTSAHVGLSVDPNESRLDAFFYQAGGSVLNAAGTKAVLNSPQDVQALTFVKSMLSAGTLKFPSQLNESDEIPALGDGKAAMIITGPWMTGEMTSDFPKISYSVHALPAGPTGDKGTLVFTNCWGIAKQNSNLQGTIDFVKFLTTPAQQLKFSKAFGVIPSLQTVASQYASEFPASAEPLQALTFAHPDIAVAGDTNALNAYNSDLAELASKSPQSILSAAQTNLQDVINQDQG